MSKKHIEMSIEKKLLRKERSLILRKKYEESREQNRQNARIYWSEQVLNKGK